MSPGRRRPGATRLLAARVRFAGHIAMTARLAIRLSAFPLLIRRSRIDRFGVFARQSIPPRRKVIEYAGEKVTIAEARRRFARILRQRGTKRFYFFRLNSRWSVDGAVGGSGAELINHSCSPNLFVRRSSGRIFYYARRRIRKGEELTLDYRFPTKTIRVPCHCGSPHCRGTINRLASRRK